MKTLTRVLCIVTVPFLLIACDLLLFPRRLRVNPTDPNTDYIPCDEIFYFHANERTLTPNYPARLHIQGWDLPG